MKLSITYKLQGRGLGLMSLVLTWEQVLKNVNDNINRKNTKVKGPFHGCDQIDSILQMTKQMMHLFTL